MEQQGGRPAFNNADFTDIDQAAQPQALVEQQNHLNSLRDVNAYKQRMHDVLAPQPGDQLLDAGCGSGADVIALGARVGTTGHVIGVDRSATMVTEAQARAQGLGLPVSFQTGNITQLDFPDGSFDGCRADRVLHHLDEPALALSELVRVTKSGGRIVVFEPDFESFLFGHPDHATSRRIVDVFADSGARKGRLARHLYALFHRQGLVDVNVELHTLLLRDLATIRAGGLSAALALTLEAGVLSAEEVAAWTAAAEELDREGCFMLSVVSFLVSGRKA